MTSVDQVREGTNILKPKTKMADKENANRPTWSKNNIMMEKNCIPLKPNELTNSTIEIDTHTCEDNNQLLSFLLIKDDPQIQHMSLNQTFHLKRNNKEKLMPTEKPKQDVNIPKKPVLGFYRGKVVESKINSFRKPLQVKDESSATNKKPSAIISNATKPQPMSTSNVTVKSDRASNVTTTTKIVSSVSQSRRLVQPPIRSHHDHTQYKVKQGISRTSANVTIQKGPRRKELIQLKTDLSCVKTSSAQDIKRNEARSRSIASEIVARPASSSNIKLIEKSETIDQRRHTIAKTSVSNRSAQPKETTEQRKARLTEWKAGKGRVLKRPPSSAVTQPEAAGQNEKPAGSFWTTMAEEDEQRLFTEKVNKTFSECLNLINEGCPKEEILVTLNDLIKNIPDAKKLVKYWVCLARLEPVTSPIEHIITIYEKAILAGAQPIEEMRHAIADILTMKSQEKVNFGENIEEGDATKEQVQEVSMEDAGVNLEPGKPKLENKHHRSVMFHDCEKEQEDKTKDPGNDIKTPDKETRESCLIKYNVSSTPYLQSAKKKIQFDNTNSIFKELKFLTPVRRSRRLQDKTSKLPDMLKDHYPCVSSLEQLTELGRETDAFVCRPNAALCLMYSETETTEEK
ncbi:cytoskeleton-associated protein 2-like isoform X1 [Trichechus manatus latirostris]|uniref:Cytoskeleton-associated protein 2-like isoform X1 n=2 Tax=Trichechus manatus latirostris TaxID=127582 RepID=A0A2Y9RWM1_TRIMA|nr:cytoskeleton-associated protein 2-like isoform X1 [Trichechus manatus latirostris]XP_023597986.1 cytoskeleton-associated protein 2-like isoform X1 [Trichechus manatus latirostris]